MKYDTGRGAVEEMELIQAVMRWDGWWGRACWFMGGGIWDGTGREVERWVRTGADGGEAGWKKRWGRPTVGKQVKVNPFFRLVRLELTSKNLRFLKL
jgi:hypothetical protein